MPITGLKIFSDTGEEFLPENAPQIDPELPPDPFDLSPDPEPSDDGPGIHDPVPPPPRPGRPPVPAVTRQVEREVREELDAILRLMALAWSVPDPSCGSVLSDQSTAIAAALTALLKKNPRLLASLRGAGWLGEWVGLAMALTPVVRAFYAHHLAPPIPEQETTTDGDPTAPRSRTDYAAYLPRTGGAGTGNPPA